MKSKEMNGMEGFKIKVLQDGRLCFPKRLVKMLVKYQKSKELIFMFPATNIGIRFFGKTNKSFLKNYEFSLQKKKVEKSGRLRITTYNKSFFYPGKEIICRLHNILY